MKKASAFVLLLIFCLVAPSLVFGQAVISTYTGTGIGDGGPAAQAEELAPYGIARDAAGNTYVSNQELSIIQKINPAGIITTICGTGISGHSGDGGPATAAAINGMYGLATDRIGNIYFTEYGDNCVRQISPSGIITTIAGTTVSGYSGDGGSAAAARLSRPMGIAVDTSGNIFIADNGNFVVRKINTAGIISTVLGNGTTGTTGNGGPATAASLGGPTFVATDKAGNFYVSEFVYNCVCKVNAAGIVQVIAGNGTTGFSGDGGPATAAQLSGATGLGVDAAGNVYFSDLNNYRIREVNHATGIISTIGGNGISGYAGDGGSATAASIGWPWGLTSDTAGNIAFCDITNNRVRTISTTGAMATLAGENGQFDEGIPASAAKIGIPENLAFDASGNLYIADIANQRVRMVNKLTGVITTFAGSGIGGYFDGYGGDGGPATAAHMDFPSAIAFDKSGNAFICDQDGQRIREVNTAGIITTFAGNGTYGFAGDGGPATAAEFHFPTGVVIDSSGNVFICDNNNHRIRKVDRSSGIISTVAGTGITGYTGDGGPATNATLAYPADVAMDSMGNLYICDGGNNAIRKVTPGGTITTIAGTGSVGFDGDGGPGVSAELFAPYAIKSDKAGNIYITDHANNRIRLLSATGIINTIAGSGLQGFSGDGGDPLLASLYFPTGVAVAANGDVYVGDGYNCRVRKITSTTGIRNTTPVQTYLSVFPNPTAGEFTVRYFGQAPPSGQLTLTNVAGQVVRTQAWTDRNQLISLAGLPAGLYQLEATAAGGWKRVLPVVKE